MITEWKKRMVLAILHRVRILAEYEPNGVICMAYTAFLTETSSNL